jgi:hypothetical protein
MIKCTDKTCKKEWFKVEIGYTPFYGDKIVIITCSCGTKQRLLENHC